MKLTGRKLLFLIGRLHLLGYCGLRVMPMFEDENWVLLIGPRTLFSTLDGAYVPPDLRHRCIKYVETDEPLPDQVDPARVIESLYYRPRYSSSHPLNALLAPAQKENSSEERERFREWLGQCRVSDAVYEEWYLTLCGRLVVDDEAVPVRPDREAEQDNPLSNFGIAKVCAGGVIRTTRWPAPPGGRCFSSGAANKHYDPSIEVAQPRAEAAPDLVWPNGSNTWSDSRIDEWYDENNK